MPTPTLPSSEYSVYKINDFLDMVQVFEKLHQPDLRYSSFDYCYNYFHPSSQHNLTHDMERSCLSLGFYLASWGMFRGSSFLLETSSRHFVPVIEYISDLPDDIWMIDAHNYDDENIDSLIDVYENIRARLIYRDNAHLTLITKIMLGVFGSTPAFDRLFIDTFRNIFNGHCGFTSFNRKSLESIHLFYLANMSDIEHAASHARTLRFKTGERSGLQYTRAKVIDMYGFTKGSVD